MADEVDAPVVDDAPDAAVPEASGGDSVYVVAFISDADGSVVDRVLAGTDLVEDGTEVWMESMPDDRSTMAELEDRVGVENIEWDSEPQPYVPPQTVQASLGAADAGFAEQQALDEIEERVKRAEGLTAGLLMDTVLDEDEPVAHTAAVVDAGDEVDADQADPEEEALSEESGDRLADLLGRVDRLEDVLADLMDSVTGDEELDAPPDAAVVDERRPEELFQ
jgi:hypothetical protein